eukprot:7240283-Alexandrium_andersonii.AAC.1
MGGSEGPWGALWTPWCSGELWTVLESSGQFCRALKSCGWRRVAEKLERRDRSPLSRVRPSLSGSALPAISALF